MSAVRYGVSVRRACIRCVVTEEDIISSPMASKRSLKDITIVRRRLMANLKKTVLKFRDGNELVEEGEVDSGQRLLNMY